MSKDIIGLPGRWVGDVYQYDMVQIFEERKAALAEIERLRAALREIAEVDCGNDVEMDAYNMHRIAKEALDERSEAEHEG